MSLDLLWAAWAHDPLVETIERHLAGAAAAAGGRLLRVVEGRRPADDGIPTIDLYQALNTGAPDPGPPPPGFDRIVAATCDFERTEGAAVSRPAVEDRLRRCSAHARRILHDYRPDAVLVWNGLLSQRAVIAACARDMNIPVRFCERGMLPGSWVADPLGVNAAGSLVADPLAPGLREALDAPLSADRRETTLALIADLARRGASAWGQPPRRGADAWRRALNIPAGARVLFMPLQVDADTNTQFFSPFFAGSLDALAAVADTLAAAGDWFLLVKPHPQGRSAPDQLQRAAARARHARVVADLNLHDALELADLVVTINSNAAAEAVWNRTPVLQLGRGVLTGKNIVAEFDPHRALKPQLDEALDAWHDDPGRFERALRFLAYLRQHYLLDADSPDDARRLVDQLQADLPPRPAPTPPRSDLADLVRQFTWQPAVRLLDQIAARPDVRRTVLVGFGQNALRLLQTAPLHPVGQRLQWSAWDEADTARREADRRGIAVVDPLAQRLDATDALLVVTPRDAAHLGQRLTQRGYTFGQDWLYLIPPA